MCLALIRVPQLRLSLFIICTTAFMWKIGIMKLPLMTTCGSWKGSMNS